MHSSSGRLAAAAVLLALLFNFGAAQLSDQDIDICDDVTIDGQQGTLFSPNYPEDYLPSEFCSKTFFPRDGQKLEVVWRDFQLELSEKCAYDAVRITIGGKKLGVNKYCDRQIPVDFTTRENVTINLISDVFDEAKGFLLSWQYVPACGSDEFQCWDNSDCVKESALCDDSPDCSDNSDEMICARLSESYGQCGRNEVAPTFLWNYKVLGGDAAAPNSWPFVAQIFDGEKDLLVCTGSIISEKWILTTKKCANLTGNGSYVLLGSLTDADASYDNYTVDGKKLHPSEDVALLRIKERILFNGGAVPVCLPKASDDFENGETCVVAGWGRVETLPSEIGIYPSELHQIRVPVYHADVCRSADSDISASELCAGLLGKNNETIVDICEMDAGAPLLCMRGGSWWQVGMAVRYDNCGKDKPLGRYVELSKVSNWIESAQRRNGIDGENIDVCGPTEPDANYGSISSPNYPGLYPAEQRCIKTLVVPHGHYVRVNFTDISFERGRGCPWDGVTVTVGSEKYTGRALCDEDIVHTFTTSENVTFEFYSDETTQETGFRLEWEIFEGCEDGKFRCWNGVCIEAALQCDGTSQCSDQSDEIECAHVPVEGECGKNIEPVHFTWDYRIVGGNEAREHSYPWVVGLYYAGVNETNFCGASIISKYWLLTAAHCFRSDDPSEFYASVGGHRTDSSNRTRVEFEEIILHPDYNASIAHADIALIRVKTPMTYSDEVRHVCTPYDDMPLAVGETCIAAGWGTLSESRR